MISRLLGAASYLLAPNFYDRGRLLVVGRHMLRHWQIPGILELGAFNGCDTHRGNWRVAIVGNDV